MNSSVSLEKSKLRDQYLQLRRTLSNKERLHKDQIIAHKLARVLTHTHATSNPLRFGAYVPFGDEVNPFLELFRILEERRIPYEPAVPFFKTNPRNFKFVHPISLEQFKSFLGHTQGVDAWVCHNSSLWTESKTDVIPYWIIPGICFSKDCKRIGFGAGFYDEWLAGQQGLFIAVAYDVQMIETITPEPFDIPMDIVLTEYHTYIRPDAMSEYPDLLGNLKQ